MRQPNVHFGFVRPICGALGVLSVLALARLARPGDRLGLWPAGLVVAISAMWILAASGVVVRRAAGSRALAHGHNRERLSLPDRTARSAPVCRLGLGSQRPRPDAAALGWSNRGICGWFARCAHLFPALSGARPAIYRHMVFARHVDPHGYRGPARPAAPALVRSWNRQI